MANEIRISGAQTTPRSETDISVFHGDNTKIIAASSRRAPVRRRSFFPVMAERAGARLL